MLWQVDRQLRQRVDELCWPHHTYNHITWMVQQGRHALVRVAPAVSFESLTCCTKFWISPSGSMLLSKWGIGNHPCIIKL